jgi:hypothetical protein
MGAPIGVPPSAMASKIASTRPRIGSVASCTVPLTVVVNVCHRPRALETLVERGWVRRKRSEVDRRQYVLELTASGQRLRERVEGARAGIIERLANALDDRDVADFDRIAMKILAAFEAPSADDEASSKR